MKQQFYFLVYLKKLFIFQHDNYNYDEGSYSFREGNSDGYSNQGEFPLFFMNDAVKKYITFFRDAIRQGKMYEINALYLE